MSEFEAVRARNDLESRIIRDGILVADPNNGPWQYGHYVERMDRDGWTPLIYGADDLDDAISAAGYAPTGSGYPFRHSRIVRRAIGPWEVLDVEL